MAWQTLSFTITGESALLMHNGHLADPMNEHARAMKKITSKRKKTEADYEALAQLEFMGGLYVDEDGEPCIPGENIEGCLVGGAKKSRLGEQFKAGVMCEGNWKLKYDGPKDPEKLWRDKRFRDTRGVIVNGARVQRTRPKFPAGSPGGTVKGWSLDFDVKFDDEVVNAEQVVEALQDAGRYVGLCDYTPKFGRFTVGARVETQGD